MKVSILSYNFPSLPLHFDSPTIFGITSIPIETSYPSIVGLRENLCTIVIRYHIVASLDISYSAIAFSRSYLVILVSYLWLRLIKHSGKEEESQKKKILSKKENDHKLISKEVSMKRDTWARFTTWHLPICMQQECFLFHVSSCTSISFHAQLSFAYKLMIFLCLA